RLVRNQYRLDNAYTLSRCIRNLFPTADNAALCANARQADHSRWQRRAYWAVEQPHREVDFESGETDSPDRVGLYRGLCPRSNRLARWPESDNALAVRERCGATISKIECRSQRALF